MKKLKLTTLIAALCSALTLSTTAISAPKANCISLTKNTKLPTKAVLDYVDLYIFQQSKVPGLIVGVVYGNDSALISCGETVIGNGQYPAANTLWGIGSVSKTITGTIFAQMVAEGKVSLIDPVQKFLPDNITAPMLQHRKITLLDLVTHTSGLARSAIDDDLNNYQDQPSYDETFALNWLNKTKLLAKPGTHYLYSNYAFGLLGYSLGRAANTNYDGVVRKYIQQNLDMHDTVTQHQLTDELKARKAQSYWMNGDLIKNDWQFDFDAAGGGIYSTGNDLVKYIKYHLNSASSVDSSTNQLNHATYVYQQQVDNPLEFKDDGISLAWHVDFPRQQLPLILSKSGWVSGYTSWVMLIPSKKIGIFSISNKPYINVENDLINIYKIISYKKN